MKRSPISKKLDRLLATRISEIYIACLKQSLNVTIYYLFDQTLVIIIEDSITQVEQFLNDNQRQKLAKQVRQAINAIIYPQIRNTIEEVMQVNVIDFLSDTNIDSRLTAAIAIFELKTKFPSDNC